MPRMEGVTEADFYLVLARILATEVEDELGRLGVWCLKSSELGQKHTRSVDRNHVDRGPIYKATVIDRWPDNVHAFPKAELDRLIATWVRGMSIKLAFPGCLTTYHQELPQGVEAAALGASDNLYLRLVIAYSMFDDLKIIRIDVLASWSD